MDMLKSCKRYMNLYKIFLVQYMKTQMQSKVDFTVGFFSFFLNQMLGIIFLYLIFEQIPDLNGWSFYQLVFIYGYAQIPRGIDHFFTNNLWIFTRKTVKEGLFDRYLLRPVNPLFQILIEQCCPDGIGEFLVGMVLVIYATAHLGIAITIGSVIWFTISIIFGALIYLSLKLLLATNAFFFMDAYQILYLGYNLSDFVKYPLGIYNKPIRFTLSYIIPFGFTAFIPASFFLGTSTLYSTIILEIIVAVIFFFIAYRYFCFGCNKYESAGN